MFTEYSNGGIAKRPYGNKQSTPRFNDICQPCEGWIYSANVERL